MLFGVAGGLGEYFDVDPVLVRLDFVFLGFATAGCAILLYLVMAMVMPRGETSFTGTSDTTSDYPLSGAEEAREQDTRQSSARQDVDRGRSTLALALIAVSAIFLCASLVGSGWLFGLFSWWFNWGVFWAVVVLGAGLVVLMKAKRGTG